MNTGYKGTGAEGAEHHDTVAPAPGELELVRRFVNTHDAERDHESLGSPAELVAWLRAHGLLGRGESARRADLDAAIEVREALRSLLLANNGTTLDLEAAERLDQAARDARLGLGFASDGTTVVAPQAGGVAGALGKLLARVNAAMADGTWERLKVCPADDCLWAFYDESRNRSRRWCEMEVCGNRAKVRGYRERARRS